MRVKTLMVIAASVVMAFGMTGMAQAFHSGGVAECEGCHSMHAPKDTATGFLLVGADQSSTCLTCHQNSADTAPSSYHISTDLSAAASGGNPLQRTPGGDFSWTKKTFTYTSGTVTYNEAGGGHAIGAADFGYIPGTGNSPGGTFPAANLACNSCHDPHGQFRRLQSGVIAKTGAPIKASGSYNSTANEPTATEAVGVYRILAGSGYTKSGVTFMGVPAAKAPSTYNQSEAANQVRVAYGVATTGGHETWGTWCATCHGAMHSSGNYVHPVDAALGSDILPIYNSYVKSGDLTGTSATAFTSLVPFITNSGTYTALSALAGNTGAAAYKVGPSDGDQVACLSCHRAHASGFNYMLRFDYGYEFMTKGGNYIGSDNPEVGTTGRGPLQARGRTIADWTKAYYDRPATQFATYQRVLCNKCHAKD